MKKFVLSLVFIALLWPATVLMASSYPDKPIKLIVAASSGGLLDLAARGCANLLSQELGQPVIIANMPGGAGNVAVNSALQARPDGYTLLVVSSPHVTYNTLKKNARHKYGDFRVLGGISEQRIGIITQPDRPWKNLRDAFAEAKKKGIPLVVGVMNEEDEDIIRRIGELENVKISAVPQNSGSACLSAVLGGHVDLGMIGLLFVESALAGKVKTLASESEKRFTALPDVPTLKEQGYNLSQETLFLLMGPKDMPEEAAKRIMDAMAKLGDTAEYKEQIYNRLKMEPTDTSAGAAQKRLDGIYENAVKNYKK